MTIQQLLIQSLKNNSNNNALHTNNTYYTYKELYNQSILISDAILSIKYVKQPVIIMGMRSFYTYAGICGTIISGSYYTPLNSSFPMERNINIINQSQGDIIYLDYTDFENYKQILESINGYNIICPSEHYDYLSSTFHNHKFYKCGEKQNIINTLGTDIVYMLFTSGSQGLPKGIKINNDNLYNYILNTAKRSGITSSTKLLQMHDLSFDYSIHSLFLSLLHGSCLYIIDKLNKLNPIKYINKYEIDHVAFVPSSINMMKKIRVLKDNILLSLKYVCFCGEILPFDNALLFAKACPNAKLENLYGPTEATVACTYFEFNKDTKEQEEYCGSMPIGNSYDGMEVFLIDENKNIINNNSVGELVLSGKQLASCYVNNIKQTEEKFVKINNKDCYLTGDLCRYVNNELVFLGRNDAQVQIKGYRVELFEIENAISKIDGILSNACIPTPVDSITYEGVTAFITVDKNNTLLGGGNFFLKEILNKQLPEYMVPSKFIILESMPYNNNGKIDRNKLKTMVK